jgi:hypothetical protein
MAHWILLSPDKAHLFYRVPFALAGADGNYFYGTAHDPRDADGPWPIAAFLHAENDPHVLTLQIYTIEAEERTGSSFNPLDQSGGYLNLDHDSLTRLADLLHSEAAMLAPLAGAHKPMFHRIADEQLSDLGVRPEHFPNTVDQYYRQAYDPLQRAGERLAHTILLFSMGSSSSRAARLYFKIAQFPRHAPANRPFDVLDDSIARVNLNRAGAGELAAIIEAQSRR